MTDGLGTSSGGAVPGRDPPPTWVMLRPAIAVGLVSGLLFGIASRFIADSELFRALLGVMTLSFLCLVPLVIGYLTVRPHPSPSWSYRLLAPWLPTVLSVAVCFAVGWEGTNCIVMGLPLLLIFNSLGGVLGALAPVRGSAGAAGVMLLPFLTAPIEQRLAQPVVIHEVHTSILIEASPGTVWPRSSRFRSFGRRNSGRPCLPGWASPAR
jgi:hypothetical protein